jgi:hypothetical protein
MADGMLLFSFLLPVSLYFLTLSDGPIHSDGKTVLNEGKPAPLAASLQFN